MELTGRTNVRDAGSCSFAYKGIDISIAAVNMVSLFSDHYIYVCDVYFSTFGNSDHYIVCTIDVRGLIARSIFFRLSHGLKISVF